MSESSQPLPPPATAVAPAVMELDCGACQQRTAHQRRDDGAMVCVPCRVRAEIARGSVPTTQPVPYPVALQPAPAVVSAPPAKKLLPIMLLGGALAALSVFLPWISLGALSRSGLELTEADGTLIMIMGFIVVLLAVTGSGFVGRSCAVLFGIAIIAIALHDLGEIQQRLAALEDSPFAGAGSVGSGLYAAIAGGGLMSIGGLIRS